MANKNKYKQEIDISEPQLIDEEDFFDSVQILTQSQCTKQQFGEDNKDLFQSSNGISWDFRFSIEEQIRNIKYDQTLERQLIEQLTQIYNWSIELYKNKVKNKMDDISDFYNKLVTMLEEWRELVSKCSIILKIVRKNENVKKQEDNIKKLILDFHQKIQSFMESSHWITMSYYLNQGGIIEVQTLDDSVTFFFTFCSRENQLNNPIEFNIKLQSEGKKLVKLFQEDLLLQTLQEKLEKIQLGDSLRKNIPINTIQKKDKDYWIGKIQKKLKKKHKSIFLNIEFHKEQKIIIIHPQKLKPFIITKGNCSICLSPKQKLKFENDLQIKIKEVEEIEFNFKDCGNKLKENPENQQNQQKQELQQNRIVNDPNKSFIKLELKKFSQDLSQANFKKQYEFHLQQNQIELTNLVPGIQGVLRNDDDGFTLEPSQGQYYKLHTDNKLTTESRSIKFSIEVDLDFWITVDIDLDKHGNNIY